MDKAKWDALTDEQRDAVRDFAKQLRSRWPDMMRASAVARRVYEETINAETLHIVDSPPPDGPAPVLREWHMGAPVVNFVDKHDNPITYERWKADQ